MARTSVFKGFNLYTAAVIVCKPMVSVVGVNIAKSVVDWPLLVLNMKLTSRLIKAYQVKT